MKRCTVPGCDGQHLALGLCRTHYGRQRRGLGLDGRTYKPQPPKARPKSWCGYRIDEDFGPDTYTMGELLRFRSSPHHGLG